MWEILRHLLFYARYNLLGSHLSAKLSLFSVKLRRDSGATSIELEYN